MNGFTPGENPWKWRFFSVQWLKPEFLSILLIIFRKHKKEFSSIGRFRFVLGFTIGVNKIFIQVCRL